MTTIECSSCRKKPLSKDEVGVCKKMLGKGTKKFFCLDCFASYLDTTVEELNEKIEEFKEEGEDRGIQGGRLQAVLLI